MQSNQETCGKKVIPGEIVLYLFTLSHNCGRIVTKTPRHIDIRAITNVLESDWSTDDSLGGVTDNKNLQTGDRRDNVDVYGAAGVADHVVRRNRNGTTEMKFTWYSRDGVGLDLEGSQFKSQL